MAGMGGALLYLFKCPHRENKLSTDSRRHNLHYLPPMCAHRLYDLKRMRAHGRRGVIARIVRSLSLQNNSWTLPNPAAWPGQTAQTQAPTIGYKMSPCGRATELATICPGSSGSRSKLTSERFSLYLRASRIQLSRQRWEYPSTTPLIFRAGVALIHALAGACATRGRAAGCMKHA